MKCELHVNMIPVTGLLHHVSRKVQILEVNVLCDFSY